jgi:hypothetical protein
MLKHSDWFPLAPFSGESVVPEILPIAQRNDYLINLEKTERRGALQNPDITACLLTSQEKGL